MRSSERAVAKLVRDWDGPPERLRADVASFLWGKSDTFPAELREDPHTLGWLQQYLGEALRLREFAAHTAGEQKHSNATSTTQLYTPRWVADWLVEHTFDCIERPPNIVLDPACGGGQMLLAAADLLVRSGFPPTTAVERLHGVDLDPDAVWACRESLKLWLSCQTGSRDAAGEAGIDERIFVGDGLSDGPKSACVVVTNPPYMGLRSMPPALKARLKERAPYHLDLYLAFIDRCAATGEAVGVLAQQTVWYLKRFDAARRDLLSRGRLIDFAHLGHGIFDGLSGEKANVVAFTWRRDSDGPTSFWDARAASDKCAALNLAPAQLHVREFASIPSQPIAFWLPPALRSAFDAGPTVGDVADVPGSQNKTGNNARFVMPVDEAPDDWVPYSKGGRFAPWWGNWDWAIDWSDEARSFYAANPTSNLLAERYWFREGLCYSDFGGSSFNARWMPPGCLFDMAGPAIFVAGDDHDLLAALLVVLNSTVSRMLLNALNPTLHYQVRDVRNLPLPAWDDRTIATLAAQGHELVAATKQALEGHQNAERVLALELEADRAVALAYGTPDLVELDRRRHHRLE